MKFRFAVVVVGLMCSPGMVSAGDDAKKTDATEAAPEFSQAFLEDQANIDAGEGVWKQCRHCHGASAYPGKAPKLRPGRMEPEFIYDRVTNGFRKMPPWKAVFSDVQRKQVVAYIKSKQFSP